MAVPGTSGERFRETAEELTSSLVVARLERMPISSWHVRTRLTVGAATFFDGVDTLAIAYVLPVLIGPWRLTPVSVGILIAAGYVGQLAGGILAGWLAERLGRRLAILSTVASYAVLSLLCAASWNYTSLLIFRVLQGVGLGGEVPVAAVYINEISRAQGRGRVFLLYEQAYSAGRLAAAVLGVWVVTHLGWRYMFLIGGLPAILVLFLRRGLPESPRWLARQGRFQEAERVLREIESFAPASFAPAVTRAPLDPSPSAPVAEERPIPARAPSGWRDLFRGIYLARTLSTWVLWFAAFLLLNGLANWVPTLYTTVFRLPVETALRYGAISSLFGFAGCLAVALLIEVSGRRPWYVFAFFAAGLACLAIWWMGAAQARTVLALTSVTAFFANSIAMVVFLHTPEIYPTRMRALATGAASSWLRIASITAPLFIGLTMEKGSLAGVFFAFGAAACLAGVVAAIFAVETKGRVLEEIAP